MREAYIGVDVGTLSARAGVFDSAGQLIASARRPIAIWREPGDIVEQSSDDIWRAVTSAVREAVEASGLSPEAVRGMGFDATCSLVALDRNARPLSVSPTGAPERDVIVWMDHRAVDDAERINAGGHKTLRYVGGKISPEMHAPKLVWLARCKPETIAKAGHFFDLTDFLSFRATGSLTRSACPATCKFGYLAHERRWPDEFFDQIGLGFLKDDHYARIGAETASPGAPLGPWIDGRGRRGHGASARNAGRRRARRRARRRGGHVGRAQGQDVGRSAPASGADSRHVVELHGASDEPRFIDGIWGPHFGALDSRPMAHRWRTVGVRRSDRSSVAAASSLRRIVGARGAARAPRAREGDRRARRRSVAGGV